jgi:SRSO17 transposase
MNGVTTGLVGWSAELAADCALLAPLFVRSDARKRAVDYVQGLLASSGRKNSRWLAERAGHVSPDGIQWLLTGARWSADALRDLVRDHAVRHLGDSRAVLAFGEAGFAKKGAKSAGVAEQVNPTTGRVENCQVGSFAAYVSARGRTLVDRELYLPRRGWVEDTKRRAEAGIPDGVGFTTKPQLAVRMFNRTLASGTPFSWVAGSEGAGLGRALRDRCDAAGQPYVLEVTADHRVEVMGTGVRCSIGRLARLVPVDAFQPLAIGVAQSWAMVRVGPARTPRLERFLLIRRGSADPLDGGYFCCQARPGTSLGELVSVARECSAAALCVAAGCAETGLDDYQVRKWDSWYRHVTLSMFALAVLAGARARGVTPPAWFGCAG